MKRMKTLLLYALGVVGLMFLSYVLEDGLITAMYKPLNNNSDKVISSVSGVDIEIDEASASNVNGHISYKISNNSDEEIKDKYIKLDLYSKQGLLATTEYIKIDDLMPGESKNYYVKFKGTEISDFKMVAVSEDEVPDKSYTLNLFGFEIDLSNIFGLDVGNMKIFGKRVKDIINVDKVKGNTLYAKNWAINFAKSVPWWGYAIGGAIIIWYMPVRYLFGIFPL